jgi:magnesium-transporting ATPase (P-type)
MITGDHPGTARAIGEQLGIVDKDHNLVKTGPEIDQMTMEQLRAIVMQCNVYARASPENKISIVRALQAEGKVCSMTGDGVNDAPALRAADIGVAMGITGTDVSKDAAKMILTDDNFATILVAVKEGRRVWDNLRKLLIFNMPASFAQGGVVFFALCLQWSTVPLSAIQILYVNMITACTLGLMLAVEPCEEDIMQRPPRVPTARLLGLFFYWRTFFVATVFIFFVLGSVAWINAIATPYTIQTEKNSTIGGIVYTNTTNTTVYAASENLQHSIALNTLVFCEIAYAFNCRFLKKSSLHKRIFFGNPYAWLCGAVMVGLQMLITYVPGLNTFFSMGDMTGEAWGIAILFSVLLFLLVELEKALSDPMKPYTKPCIETMSRWCCSWRCRRVRCMCCQEIDYEPKAEPKGQTRLPPKLKQGASLRFVPDDLVPKEEV